MSLLARKELFSLHFYRLTKEDSCTELELASVRAMSAVVCCGPVFDSNGLNDDGYIYHFIIFLLIVYRLTKADSCTQLELASVRAMSAVVCCGPVFDSNGLNDDGYIYYFITFLLIVYRLTKEDSCTELELASVRAMSAVVCCGPVFDSNGLNDDGYIYHWLDTLLSSHDERVNI